MRKIRFTLSDIIHFLLLQTILCLAYFLDVFGKDYWFIISTVFWIIAILLGARINVLRDKVKSLKEDKK